MANCFVNYFEEKMERLCLNFNADILSTTSEKVTTGNNKFRKFKELNMNDFKKIMSKLKSTYCENDPFPISDVKESKKFIDLQKLYFEIVRMSLLQAVFPSSEKLACIKPIYKGKGDIDNYGSYRPISNLSYLSKIIEKVVHEQTWDFLKQCNIISDEQSAYRENHSTETTVCAIQNDMIDITVNGKCGILVMLDLSAAFDTVDHMLLLEDLKAVGIEGEVYEWYKSYLRDRKVMVVVSNEKFN